jgi:hypothetical protein
MYRQFRSPATRWVCGTCISISFRVFMRIIYELDISEFANRSLTGQQQRDLASPRPAVLTAAVVISTLRLPYQRLLYRACLSSAAPSATVSCGCCARKVTISTERSKTPLLLQSMLLQSVLSCQLSAHCSSIMTSAALLHLHAQCSHNLGLCRTHTQNTLGRIIWVCPCAACIVAPWWVPPSLRAPEAARPAHAHARTTRA